MQYKERNTLTGKLETIILKGDDKFRVFKDGKGWKVIYHRDNGLNGEVIDECFNGTKQELVEYILD